MQVTQRVMTCVCALMLVSASLATLTADASAAGDETFVVSLKDGVDANDHAPKLGRKYRGRTGEVFDSFGSFVFRGSADAARKMSRDPQVGVIEPDVTYKIADNPPDTIKHLNRTDVPEAHAVGYTGQGVTIAMLDTGVKRTHVVFASHNNIEGGKTCAGGTTADGEGHGTASASNAVGKIGVAHAAKLIPVKIFPHGSLSTSLRRVVCGLNWVKKHNDANPGHIDVVNMSLSGPGSRALRKAVKRLIDSGVVITAAGGNHDGAPRYPAAYPGVIAVSALAGANRMAAFSAHHGDLTAPGVNIRSAENNSNTAYSFRTGTSRSAPQVAGAVAVVLGEDPTASALPVLRFSGKCPNFEIHGDSGFCPGRWRGDEDRNAEPMVNAYCAGVRANAVDTDIQRCGF